MGNEGLEGLEARVDALHAPPLVAVGNLPPNPPFLVPLGLGGQRNVGKAARENRSRFRIDVLYSLPPEGPGYNLHHFSTTNSA